MTDTASNPPSGWQIFLLGDLLNFKNGLNKEKSFFGYGTPIINYMDVFSRSPIYARTVKGLVSVSKAEKKAFEVRKGDILFTRTSETPDEVGYAAVVMDEMEEAVFSGFVLRGRPVSSTLSNNYARYFLEASYVRQQIVASATYTTRALTNGRLLSAVKVLLPEDINEQEAIAEALSDADALIEGLERLIAKKRLIKQGAMQDLLTAKRRLPGFSEDWLSLPLGAITEMRSGDMISAASIYDSGLFPVYGGNGLRGFTDRFNREGQCTLIGRQGALCGAVVHTQGKIFASEHAIVCRATNGNYQKFVSHLYEFLNLNRVSEASAQPGLSVDKVKKINTRCPRNFDEQKQIADILDDIDAEIQALETRLGKARQVKEGMMQNLLTGRIRLV